MSSITNEDRTEAFGEAVQAYCESKEQQSTLYDDPEGVAGDMIGDLCHWLAAHDVDPERVVRSALMNFEAEVEEEAEDLIEPE